MRFDSIYSLDLMTGIDISMIDFLVGGAAQTCDLSLDSAGDKWNVLLCFI